jgi:hypothetical protein
VAFQRVRQGIAEARSPDVQRIPQRAQRIADAARRRGFLVQDDQHRQQRLGVRKAGWLVSHNAWNHAVDWLTK